MHGRLPVIVAAAGVFVTFALAVASRTHAATAPAATQGAGSIEAQGVGMLEVRGDVHARLTASYPVVLLKDIAGDATVSAGGSPGDGSFMGFTVYFSAQDVQVSGSNVVMVALGERLGLSATGVGWAYLKGTGTYATNGATSQPWGADGTVAAISAPPPSGAGLFVARGLGVVAARGTIAYQVAAGAAVLLVKDVAGSATINVTGGGHGQFLGFTAYVGFQTASIKGTDVAVIATGEDLNVTATGAGWGYVQGLGTYSMNNHASQPWTVPGQFVDIAR